MIEHIGSCIHCGKNIYCMDGFLNGVTLEGGTLICFECSEQEKEEPLE